MESAFSTLSDGPFEALQAARGSSDFGKFIEEYAALLRSLRLCHAARAKDTELLDEQISRAEQQLAPLKAEQEARRAELRGLRATSDEQRRIIRLAKDKFERRRDVGGSQLALNRSREQLAADAQALEQRIARVERVLVEEQQRYAREMELVADDLSQTAEDVRRRVSARNPSPHPEDEGMDV